MGEGERPERCSSAATDARVLCGTVAKKWIQSLDGMLKLDSGDQVSNGVERGSDLTSSCGCAASWRHVS